MQKPIVEETKTQDESKKEEVVKDEKVQEELPVQETETTADAEVKETVQEEPATDDFLSSTKDEEVKEEPEQKEEDRKFRQSYERIYGPPVQTQTRDPQPPVYTQPVSPQQQPQQWFSDAQLKRFVDERPELIDEAEAHKRTRDLFFMKQEMQREYFVDQERRESLKRVVNKYQALQNPNSRLSQIVQERFNRDPFAHQDPRGYEKAVYEVVSEYNEGQIINARNQGRNDASRDRRIKGKVIVEQQTSPRMGKANNNGTTQLSQQKLDWIKQQGISVEEFKEKYEKSFDKTMSVNTLRFNKA